MHNNKVEIDQAEFEKLYISPLEISIRLNVSRVAVSRAIQRGILPKPISLSSNKITFWKRISVERSIVNWALTLEANQ